ncbi:MAG TPA: hypothetical protein VHP38_02155 [Ruminiclostridium sp.]|nr:hypothetical protein [Ruminiclostridium sp.]
MNKKEAIQILSKWLNEHGHMPGIKYLVLAIKMAIQALQEKQQREQGCEYCNEPSKLIDIFYGEVKVKNSYIHTCSDGAGIFLNGKTVFYMSIDFCPKCGRRLNP